MFTFHCKNGEDFTITKLELAKYGDMMNDIADGADELTVDYSMRDIYGALYCAKSIYNEERHFSNIPYTFYEIYDFFCMERMMNPNLYIDEHSPSRSQLISLKDLIANRDIIHNIMCPKLYYGIIDELKISARRYKYILFAKIDVNIICNLLVDAELEDLLIYALEYYLSIGKKEILSYFFPGRAILDVSLDDNISDEVCIIREFISTKGIFDMDILRELVSIMKSKDKRLRGKVSFKDIVIGNDGDSRYRVTVFGNYTKSLPKPVTMIFNKENSINVHEFITSLV